MKSMTIFICKSGNKSKNPCNSHQDEKSDVDKEIISFPFDHISSTFECLVQVYRCLNIKSNVYNDGQCDWKPKV